MGGYKLAFIAWFDDAAGFMERGMAVTSPT